MTTEIGTNQKTRCQRAVGVAITAGISWVVVSLIMLRGGFPMACALIPVSPALVLPDMIASRAYGFLAITAVVVDWGLVLPAAVISTRTPLPRPIRMLAHVGLIAYMFWSFVILACVLV